MKPQKNCLITDLDNTLFDWVDLWVKCFSSMLGKIVEISGISEEQLIPEIAAIHQKHGTSEYSFLIDELPSLKPFLRGRSAADVFAPAIDAYREQRRQNLKLYPTVKETLSSIKSSGSLIVGYTESMAFYSNYRIRRLELDGVLDYIFCPQDHVLPDGISTEAIRKYPASSYKLELTKQKFTPKGSKKPDKDVLNSILTNLGIQRSSCVYIGDSLMKDVVMANDCDVSCTWAKYGIAHARPEYGLLKKVTHWTPEEVEREQRIKDREDAHPDYVADENFSQILEEFDFMKFQYRE